MTKTLSTNWDPEQDLTALLDALAEEVLAAPDHEVAGCVATPDDTARALAQDMRRLVAAAETDLILPSVSDFMSDRFRHFVTRKQ